MANADMLFILNKYDEVIGALSNTLPESTPFFEDLHTEILENGYETFEFKTPIAHPSGVPDFIKEENKVLVQDMDNIFHVFRIKRVQDNTVSKQKIIFAETESIELLNDPVRPMTVAGSPLQILDQILFPSRWKAGTIETAATNELILDEYTSVLAALHETAKLFDLEIRFRITFNGSKITGRFVDLLQRRGNPKGSFFDYSQDIKGLTRTKDTTELATALIPVGKSDDEENATTIKTVAWSKAAGNPMDKPLGQDWIGDPDALQQFGVEGRHIFRVYMMPDESDPMRLLSSAWDELQRRIKGSIEYEVDLVLLEGLPGFAHKKARIGDTITIKDTSFATPLILEARILEMKRSKSNPSNDAVVLGEYREREISDSELIRRLQAELAKKSAIWSAGGFDVIESPTPPQNVAIGQFWLNTGKIPNVWNRWDGSTWIPATPDRADQLTYSDGLPVEYYKPAAPGADKTSNNTAKDTSNVGGIPAAEVRDEAQAGQNAQTKIQTEVGTGTIETTAGALKKSGPVSITAPINPANGDKWVDISKAGLEVWKRYNSTTKLWEEIGRVSLDQMTGQIVTGQIGFGQVQTDQLADLAITLGKMAANSVDINKIVNDSISAAKIQTDAITQVKMANGAVGINEIIDASISAIKIQTDAITNTKILNGAVDINKIVDNAISAAKIQADAVTGIKILNGAVDVNKIVDNAISAAKIQTNAVTNPKILNDAVDVYKIVNNAISAAKIQTDAITNIKIQNDAVDVYKIVNNAVSAGKIQTDAITTIKIQNDAVDVNKILNNAITEAKIIAGAVTNTKIGTGAITEIKIDTGSVTNAKIGLDAITNEKIANDAITSAEILNRTIGNLQIALLGITNENVANRTIAAGKIVANAITAGEIASRTITADRIVASAITANEIAATTITAAKIASRTITADRIVASAITANEIAANTITAAKIAANTITANEIATGAIVIGSDKTTFADGYDPTDLLALTKRVGTELIPAGYRQNANPRTMPFRSGSYEIVPITEIEPLNTTGEHVIKTMNYATLKTESLPFDPDAPVYVSLDVYYPETTTADGTIYVQTIYFDEQKRAMGSNESALTLVSNKTVPTYNTWHTFEGYLEKLNPTQVQYNASYIGVRFLIRYSTGIGPAYVRNVSWKTLQAQYLANYRELITATDDQLTLWKYPDTTYINGGQIFTNSITANQIAAGTITSAEIAAKTIQAEDIAANAITATEIKALTITGNEIAANAITATQIAGKTITAAEIVASTITTNEIAANTIQAVDIAATTITGDRLVANTITAAQIAATTITAAQIATRTISADRLVADSITSNEIKANTITAADIAATTITAAQIATRTISADRLIADSITSNEIKANTIVASDIAATTITGDRLVAKTITAAQIAANTITANEIAANAITIGSGTTFASGYDPSTKETPTGAQTKATDAANLAVKPAMDRITLWQHLDTTFISGGQIFTDSITANQIAANAITTSEILANAVTTNEIAANTIQAGDIAATTITGDRMVANTITASQIAGKTITAAQILASTITTNEIAVNTITAADIAGTTITGDRLVANTITATQIASRTILADRLVANSITSNEIMANTIQASDILANTITGDRIASRTIAADRLIANSITANEIASKTITAAHIASNTITTDLISATGISADVIKGGTISASVLFAGKLNAATGTFSGDIQTPVLTIDNQGTGSKLRMRMTPGYDSWGNPMDTTSYMVFENFYTAAMGSIMDVSKEDNGLRRPFDIIQFSGHSLIVDPGNGGIGQIQAWRLNTGDGGLWMYGDISTPWDKDWGIWQQNGGPIIRNTTGGNTVLNATGGDIYIGQEDTYGIRLLAPMRSNIDLSNYVISTNRTWDAPYFYNGAGHYASTAYENVGVFKDVQGFIHIRGMAKPPTTTGAAMFIIPTPYRPAKRRMFAVQTSAGLGRVDVDPNGYVYMVTGPTATNGFISFDGVYYNS